MIYNLSNPLELEKFRLRVSKLESKGCVVELKEKVARSLNQNSYLHLILSYFGAQTGNTLEDVKRIYYKHTCNADLYEYKVQDKLLNRERIKLKSSKELTTEQMTLSISRFRDWAAQIAGVYIPSSDEYLQLLFMQQEVERNKEYL